MKRDSVEKMHVPILFCSVSFNGYDSGFGLQIEIAEVISSTFTAFSSKLSLKSYIVRRSYTEKSTHTIASKRKRKIREYGSKRFQSRFVLQFSILLSREKFQVHSLHNLQYSWHIILASALELLE